MAADSERQAIASRLLLKLGWQEFAGVPERYSVWRPRDERVDGEILLPVNPALSDFPMMVDRAIRDLMRRYGLEAEKNLRLIEVSQSAQLDETEWRKESPIEGMIGWTEGEELYASARAQLVASAKSSKERRPYHGKAGAYLANNFLAKTLMGQTDVGSFIITAYTPSSEKFHVSRASEKVAESQPRKSETIAGSTVLDTFETALSAIRDGLVAYRRSPRLEPFLEATQDGVSYELVSALTKFVGGGDATVRVTRRPANAVSRVANEYAFQSHEAGVLERVATEFTQDVAPRSVTIEGEVTDLSRKVKDGVRDRVIRIDAFGSAGVRKVRVHLNAEQYEIAMAAHGRENWIRVTGRVEREGNLNWMYSPQAVAEVEAPDEELGDDPLDIFDDLD